MNKIEIILEKDNVDYENSPVNIIVKSNEDEELLYKFLCGSGGKWTTIKEYGKESCCIWSPTESGEYTIMVYAKSPSSSKSFDYCCRAEYITKDLNKIVRIKGISLNRDKVIIDEPLAITVDCTGEEVLYRFLKVKDGEETLLKDYSSENYFNLIPKDVGDIKIVVQVKNKGSISMYDSEESIEFYVWRREAVKIQNLMFITKYLIVDEELIVDVDIKYSDKKNVLYKCIKIDEKNNIEVVQEFSSKNVISFKESKAGKYKLLVAVKDMYSGNEYDDRALINYEVKNYKTVRMESFIADVISPKSVESDINFRVICEGGKSLRYNYKISREDGYEYETGFIKDDTYCWKPTEIGTYKIRAYVKDQSYSGEYEDSNEMEFVIEEHERREAKILDILKTCGHEVKVGNYIQYKVMSDNNKGNLFAYRVSCDNEVILETPYRSDTIFRYSPEKVGKYSIEIMVRNKFSDNEYDAHDFCYFNAYLFVPCKIDKIISYCNETPMPGDKIIFETIVFNAKEAVIKYDIRINGFLVEESDYTSNKKFSITPKCGGLYNIDVYSKNENSNERFESKKSVYFKVRDVSPVYNVEVQCDVEEKRVNCPITFNASCEGGRSVNYQFYIDEGGEWKLVQEYCRKSYYTFIPFKRGQYRIMVLCRSANEVKAYEDYRIIEFEVK
ncbi:triple tyrosine motif-containing protein [uncultured Clostridium sp.]|uniref:triple tyrosine motif-containing protein n=1 Tax=uncultured Clostridium sp. TaxID=59620 RepID=UPI0025F7A3AB|nr:triple tyrosine motif-containing protein [uncultured Clostridium sp.]